MSPALALLVAAALGADARIDTGIRAEARFRHLDPAPTPPERNALDLTATPHLILGVTGGLGTLSATYAPRLTAADVGPDLRWEHMHEGELRLRLAPGPTWNLEGFASGGIGRTDLITENRNAGAATGGGTGGTSTSTNTIATLATVDLQRLRGGLALTLAPGRRTQAILSGAVSEDGGTTRLFRTVLPSARSAEAGAELRWNATRLAQLGVRLAASTTHIESRPQTDSNGNPVVGPTDSAWGSALATWRRRLDPQVEMWAGAGAVAMQSKVPTLSSDGVHTEHQTQRRTAPAGELGIVRTARTQEVATEQETPQEATASRPVRLRQDATGRLVAMLGGSVDRLTGVATPTLDVRGELRWPVSSSVAVVGQGTGTLTWPSSGRTRRGQLELGLARQLTPRALIEIAGYGSWQNSDDPTVLDLSEYGAFLRLTLDARPITY